MARTGYKGYSQLEQYDTVTGISTGIIKSNVDTDPDYVAPVLDLTTCPIDGSYVYMMRIYAIADDLSITIDSGGTDFKIIVKDGTQWADATHYETATSSTNLPQHLTVLGGSSTTKSVFIQVDGDNYAAIKKIICTAYNINEAFMNSFTELEFLTLPGKTTTRGQNINNIELNACTKLKELKLTYTNLGSLNLSAQTLLELIHVQYSTDLSSLVIGSYPVLRELRCNECRFTELSYSTSIIDGIIIAWNNNITVGTGKVFQYGTNNTSGILPSTAASDAYLAMVSKGVTVIGKQPISGQVELIIDVLVYDSVHIEYRMRLAEPISENINIITRLRYTYNHREGNIIKIYNFSIPGGQTESSYTSVPFDFTVYPDDDIIINIMSVTPNPAGGKQLVYMSWDSLII